MGAINLVAAPGEVEIRIVRRSWKRWASASTGDERDPQREPGIARGRTAFRATETVVQIKGRVPRRMRSGRSSSRAAPASR
ncbi:hypothetical protein [Cupriavidus taiwanensis]|uniref:hypothetical protein n=1 Tax=Cupriavidus taiwanensis TaxID=164546 RepID=UPI001F11D267|nr:hypothetical protein [Cupriavidus taiwanensis]